MPSDFGAVSLMRYPTLTRSIYLRYESFPRPRVGGDRRARARRARRRARLARGTSSSGGAAHRSTPGTGRRATPTALGPWRWPAFGVCIGVVGVFLLLPVGVLLWWTIDAAAADATPASRLRSTPWSCPDRRRSDNPSSLPVAALAWRYPSRRTALLQRLAYVPNAVPGIALALALVFFGARYGGILYQTLGMLVLAYVLRFLSAGPEHRRAPHSTGSAHGWKKQHEGWGADACARSPAS